MKTTLLALGAATLGVLAAGSNAQGIDPASKEALLRALDAERKGEAQYRATIQKFGQVTPYIHIVEAEVQHQRALEKVMARFGLSAPPNPWIRHKFVLPATLAEAARRDAEEEREYALELRRYVSTLRQPEVTSLFARLAQVNVERHAAALDRTAQGLPCEPPGFGNGQGRMQGKGRGQGQGQQRRMGNHNGACVCDGTGPQGMGPGNKGRGAGGRGNGHARNRP